ncbi:hypothetical protein [Rubritalea sp.]|uniref:hypothetical protein n=1 Tax=Rubritalea sp. TaxID=2109375 RepID=UPI003EF7CECA
MELPIQIVKVKSRSTGTEYYSAFPQADTDMATDGLLIVISRETNEIQLHLASAEQYPLGPYDGAKSCAMIQNNKHARSDLRASSIDIEAPSYSSSNCNFAFHDILELAGHADVIESLTVDEFIRIGGTLHDYR